MWIFLCNEQLFLFFILQLFFLYISLVSSFNAKTPVFLLTGSMFTFYNSAGSPGHILYGTRGPGCLYFVWTDFSNSNSN